MRQKGTATQQESWWSTWQLPLPNTCATSSWSARTAPARPRSPRPCSTSLASTPRMGTTHDGKSYLDYDAEEIKRKFTISTSLAPIPYKDFKINLLDTSGHPDFIGDTLATMQAAEMALFVVDAVAGPQVMTTKLWREAEGMRLSRAVYINHIDRENADFDDGHGHAARALRLAPGAGHHPHRRGRRLQGRHRRHPHEGALLRRGQRFRAHRGHPAGIRRRRPGRARQALRPGGRSRRRAHDEVPGRRGAAHRRRSSSRCWTRPSRRSCSFPCSWDPPSSSRASRASWRTSATVLPASAPATGASRLAGGDSIRIDESKRPAAFVFKTVSDPFVGRLSFFKVHRRRAGARAWSSSTPARARRNAWGTCTS